MHVYTHKSSNRHVDASTSLWSVGHSSTPEYRVFTCHYIRFQPRQSPFRFPIVVTITCCSLLHTTEKWLTVAVYPTMELCITFAAQNKLLQFIFQSLEGEGQKRFLFARALKKTGSGDNFPAAEHITRPEKYFVRIQLLIYLLMNCQDFVCQGN